MASFNEIQVGRYNAILHKLLDMKEGAPAPQLGGDIVPAIVLESDRPEWSFLGGMRNCIGGIWRAGGGATLYSKQALVNPVGSNVLAVIDMVSVHSLSNGRIALQYLSNGVALIGTTNRQLNIDSRSGWVGGFGTNPTCQVRFEESVGPTVPGNAFVEWSLPTSGSGQQNIPLNMVIGPGHGLVLIDQVLNQAMNTFWVWRERVLEPSETR